MSARLLREPPVVLILAGALLLGAFGLLNRKAPQPDDRRIVVSAATIDRMVEAWTREWQRAPDPGELSELIDAHVREEVLYREALALGLEKDDPLIRRHLAQRMELLSAQPDPAAEPSVEQLRAYYKAHAADFSEPARLSFVHVYFDPANRGSELLRDAQQLLGKLRAGQSLDTLDVADPFPMQSDYRFITRLDTAQLFGDEFATALFNAQIGTWQGPLRSGFGLHLVRVLERWPARRPSFEEVAERVRLDYEQSLRRRANQAVIENMKKHYEIVVEMPAGSTAAG